MAEGRTYTVLALTLMEFGCYFSPLMQGAIVAGIERHPLLTGSADDEQEPFGGTAAHRAEVVRVLTLFRSYHPDSGSQERQKVASEARRLADRVLSFAQFPRLTRGQQSLH